MEQPAQGSLALEIRGTKKRAQRRAVPASLRVSATTDIELVRNTMTAGQLLTWLPRGQHPKLTIPITVESALLLLTFFPPAVCELGNRRWICGCTMLTASLLELVPAEARIDVIHVDPANPLAEANLPIQLLLVPEPMTKALRTAYDLARLLGAGAPPNQITLATALGVSQSTISRALKQSGISSK